MKTLMNKFTMVFWKSFFLKVLLISVICIFMYSCSNETVLPDGMSENYPVIFYTSDGGNTWDYDTIASNSFKEGPFESFVIVSPNVYSVTYRNNIYYSNDDFHTWIPSIPVNSPIFTKFCANSGNGFAISSDGAGSYIYGSSNGTDWSVSYSINLSNPYFNDIDIRQNKIIAIDKHGATYSVNGGNSWQSVVIPGASFLLSVSFIDQNKACALDQDGKVYFTSDDGNSWSSRADIGSNSYNITFRNGSLGFLTSGTILYRTSDEGLTWTPASTNASPLFSIKFAGSNCFAVSSGKLLKSADDGSTWNQVYLPVNTANLSQIYFQDDGLFGYITGRLR